jgi:hypothetical protein
MATNGCMTDFVELLAQFPQDTQLSALDVHLQERDVRARVVRKKLGQTECWDAHPSRDIWRDAVSQVIIVLCDRHFAALVGYGRLDELDIL